jgi:iron complex transport system permease protein
VSRTRGTGGIAVVFLLAVVGIAFLLSVRFGSVEITLAEIFDVFAGRGSETNRLIITELRIPRALLALLVGGGLALAGSVFQALLRNPLAEPYIMGISGGAATGAVLVLAAGWVTTVSWALPLAAFAGAAVAILLVFGVALSADRRMDVRVLLLSGVVVGAFFSACIALIFALSNAATLRSAVIWMMGSLGGASWQTVAIVAAYTLPLSAVLLGLARALDLMAIGEETARYLGTRVERVKRTAYSVASLIAAAGVAFAGVIGFVGLVVPHGVRILMGSNHRLLLPLSFLAGGAFLILADLLARTVAAPAEIPIGVITAFVGVPFFLLLLRRSLRG